ncbi:hypothetical protein [Pelosinus sp. UFO1]|uniref:hypothetical protein n=1 Tax=Pelosinus sp. UFO1 TaxID=484770 RepID=UPI0004D0BAD1|nr:hypothetical protein [Pelosinus sp. UFO1]AIF50043.1 hypothetical protein UFO1_0482 [Pelosinus sp. UFO1]
MDYVFLLLALLAGIHGISFCLWLKKNGNGFGAFGVFVLVFFNIALPIYHMISEGL